MINCMDLERKFERMVQSILAIMFLEKRKEKAAFYGLMGPNMKVDFLKIIFTDMEFIYEPMVENIQANEKIIL